MPGTRLRQGFDEASVRVRKPQSCILEKSATARVAARISLSSFRRFSRTFGSSSLTLTLSKNASTAGRSFAIALMAAAKSSFATAALASTFACSIAFASELVERRIRRAVESALVLLLLDRKDIACALGACEQIPAVIGIEEFSKR